MSLIHVREDKVMSAQHIYWRIGRTDLNWEPATISILLAPGFSQLCCEWPFQTGLTPDWWIFKLGQSAGRIMILLVIGGQINLGLFRVSISIHNKCIFTICDVDPVENTFYYCPHPASITHILFPQDFMASMHFCIVQLFLLCVCVWLDSMYLFSYTSHI